MATWGGRSKDRSWGDRGGVPSHVDAWSGVVCAFLPPSSSCTRLFFMLEGRDDLVPHALPLSFSPGLCYTSFLYAKLHIYAENGLCSDISTHLEQTIRNQRIPRDNAVPHASIPIKAFLRNKNYTEGGYGRGEWSSAVLLLEIGGGHMPFDIARPACSLKIFSLVVVVLESLSCGIGLLGHPACEDGMRLSSVR